MSTKKSKKNVKKVAAKVPAVAASPKRSHKKKVEKVATAVETVETKVVETAAPVTAAPVAAVGGPVEQKNPYREGTNYHAIFGKFMTSEKISKADLVLYAMNELKLTPTSALAAVGVVLSPSKENQGNFSAMGHLYFAESSKAEGEKTKRYTLVWRETVQEHVRRAVIRPEGWVSKRGRQSDPAVAERRAKEAKEKAERKAAREAKRLEKANRPKGKPGRPVGSKNKVAAVPAATPAPAVETPAAETPAAETPAAETTAAETVTA